MGKYSAWGFGKFAIRDNNFSSLVVFDDSYCVLGFEEVSEVKENLNNEEVIFLKGYRAICDVNIKSLGKITYRNLLQLIKILDSRHYTIYPFYNHSIPISKQFALSEEDYDMREDSDFSIKHYENFLQSGQYIELTFRARKLVTQRPQIHNDEDLLCTVGSKTGLYNRFISRFFRGLLFQLEPQSPDSDFNVIGAVEEDLYYSFDGIDDYIDLGTGKPTDLTGDITISAWINPDSAGGNSLGRIIDNGKLQLLTYSTDPILLFYSDGDKQTRSASLGGFNTWKHVLVTRKDNGDGTSNTNFYVNRELSGTADQDSGRPISGDRRTIIGNNFASDRAFDGYIGKDLKIYNRLLSPAEILNIYDIEKKKYGF